MPTDEELIIEAGQDESFGFGNAAGKGTIGTGLLGASTYMMRGQTPGGIRRTAADYASNRLEGFYKKGAWKAPRYGLELTKTASRMGRDAWFNLSNADFYNKTGVSPVLIRDLEDINKNRNTVLNKYLSSPKGFSKKDALNEIKFGEKKFWFKATNDKANQLLFGGSISPDIERIVGDKVKLTNMDDFIKSTGGNKEIANYVMTRQPSINARGQTILNPKGLQFIKYSPSKFGDVLRATQFDRNMYETLLDLKKNPKNAANIIASRTGKTFSQSGTKFMFAISPKGKPDWDWGGFNSVAVWDKENPTKVRFVATDVPDVDIKGRPVPGSGGKYPAIKYVDSKEITISEAALKDQDIQIEPKKTGRKNKLGAGRPVKLRKASDLDEYKSLFTKDQQIGVDNLKSKRMSHKMSSFSKMKKLGRNLPGALGLAMNAWAMYDIYNSMKN